MNDLPPPWLTSALDEAQAMRRDTKADGPKARAELRCVAPPVGCGQPLPGPLSTAFRDQPSRNEYDITRLCQKCQDKMFAPSPEEIAEMAADKEHYGRCFVCGEYQPYQFVDVGVGTIRGFDCCLAQKELPHAEKLKFMCPQQNEVGIGCHLFRDHLYHCDFGTDHLE